MQRQNALRSQSTAWDDVEGRDCCSDNTFSGFCLSVKAQKREKWKLFVLQNNQSSFLGDSRNSKNYDLKQVENLSVLMTLER
jgi:hypothetical protein